MDIKRKWLAVFLSLVIILSMVFPVSADETRNADQCIQEILNYRYHYGNTAKTDIDCLFYELAELDPEKAYIWSSIMDYWDYANSDMTLYQGVLPDGLPQDDSLCIVVLGYALANDGSMKKELVGRLETALASAQKYPNAYIVCTGGGTARDDKTVTEAGQMAKWLIQKGVSQGRIIVENKAMSTVGNALNTCKILAESFPNVTHLALITSDYHLPRSCMLFYAHTLLTAEGNIPLLCVAANAAYKTGRSGPESMEIQADNLASLSKLPISGMKKPKLSRLDHISVLGNVQCMAGTELDLLVIAHYDTGLFRDVTNNVKYAGIDLAAAGLQEVTITYEEDGYTASSTIQIEMLAPETEPPTQPPTEVPTEAPTEAATQPPTQPAATEPVPAENDDSGKPWGFPAAILITLLIALFFIIKKLVSDKKQRKAVAAAVKEEVIDLPDDNSPLEYV